MAARPWVTVGPVQPGDGCAATPTGLSTTSRSSSSYRTTSPSTTIGSALGTSGSGIVTSSREPPCTFALRAVAAPSTLTFPASIRSAAAVRENPSIREMATSSRSPSRPSGTGSRRVSATVAARSVQRDTEEAEQRGQHRAAHDPGVGEVEDRPVPGVRAEQADPVDYVAAEQPGLAEDPVDQVSD